MSNRLHDSQKRSTRNPTLPMRKVPIEEVTTSARPHGLTRFVIPLLLTFQTNASFLSASRISITNGAQPLWQHTAFVPPLTNGEERMSTVLESHRPVVWQRTDRGLLLLLPGVTQPGVTRSFTTVTEKGETMGATDLAVQQTADHLLIGNSYFRVEHPRTGNGGFPTTIRFNQSGVEDTQFVFEDRLFEPKAGYRTWRADENSTARIVESGPLEVIVEAKAQATGAPGNPRATYRYRYRAYSPLIEVTAHVERDDDYPWRELHFLQISRKDNCYPKWAGGEPTQTGSFTDASRGYSLDRWAMMANEDDALGLSVDGTVTLYDGVSEYYNYLQQSIGPFTARSADFRALVYVGPARSPERVRGLLTREPTITVKGSSTETESPPERNAPRPAPIAAGNDAVSIGFASAREGLGVVSLFNRRTGHEYMTKTPGKPLLWRLVLHRIDGTPLLLDNTQPALCEVAESSRKGRKVTDLTWKGITVGEEAEALSVTARVELPSGSDTTTWSLDVDNCSKHYGLWEIQFPLLSGLSERGMPDVAVPRSNWGYLYRNLATTIAGSYPSADWPMQFLLVNEGEHGLYLAAHDPGAQPKRFSYTPGGEFHFCTYAENMGVPGSSFHSPFPVAVGMYKGNWWRGAKMYRAWALHQPWTSRGPLATRKDTPDAMKNLGLWMLSGGTKGEVVPGMMKAKDFFGVPLGVHWYTWHQIPFDVHYPDYFPTKPGFAQGVRALTRAGIIAMPYINGRLWDTANEDFAVGRAGACKQPDGKTTYIEEYGSGAKLAPMCPTTRDWQDKVNEIVRRLIHECGVNAIYLDQIAAAGPQLCFDPTHGHPLGGGRHWVDGYRQLLTRVRSQTKGRVGITTENNAEPYMDNVDAFLIWNPRSDLEIPMMTAVYSGYTIYFSSPAHGTYEPGAFRMMQGRDFLWGCQQGWMGFELLEKTQRQNAEYLREVARYREVAKDFLVYGELVGELKPTTAISAIESTWGGWGGATRDASLPAVMGTVWRSRDGRCAVLIANLSDTPQQFAYRLDPRAWGLRGATHWTLTRVATTSQGPPTRTPVALVAPSTARTETLAPRDILVLEILPTPPGKRAQVLAETRQAKARIAATSFPTLASAPRTEVSFLTNPRAGESCVLQVRILNGSDQLPTTRLVLDLPTEWEVDPGRAVIVDDLKPYEARVLPFRCEVPAKADGSVFVRANIVTTQPGKRFPVAPPRPVTSALHFSTPPTIDGDLSEWQVANPIVLSDAAHSKVKEWKGDSDLSGRIRTGWDDRCFYLAAQVTDNAFEQSNSGKEMWLGDCLQIGIRAGPSTDSSTYEDVHEFGLALTPKGPEIWKWLPDEHAVTSGRIRISRTVTGLDYEASIPWSEMGGLLPVPGGTVGFSFTINDADGQGFRGWMEWTPGICGNKTAAPFGRMLFVP